MDSQDSLKVCRYAVDSDIFPLLESGDDKKLHRTFKPDELLPLAEYFKSQKRFSNITEIDLKAIEDHLQLRNQTILD
jgi:pyruvate/2-oxoacid:ferredoxin oxidoreductase beta subunit